MPNQVFVVTWRRFPQMLFSSLFALTCLCGNSVRAQVANSLSAVQPQKNEAKKSSTRNNVESAIKAVASETEPKLRRRKDRSVLSVIFMLKEHREVTNDQIKNSVLRAFPSITFGPKGEMNILGNRGSLIGLQFHDQFIQINSGKGSFLSDDDDGNEGWIAISDVREKLPKSLVYQTLVRIGLELCGEKCEQIYLPQEKRLVPYSAKIKLELNTPDVLTNLEQYGTMLLRFGPEDDSEIVYADEDDPRMLAARKEAQQRWPDFVKAFKARDEHDWFYVKKKFKDGNAEMHMWVRVTAIDGDVASGWLDGGSDQIKNLKDGDRTSVKRDELDDWMHDVRGEPGKRNGAFMQKVIEAIRAEEEKKRSKQHADNLQLQDRQPQIQAATAEAKQRWPEFVKAFTDRKKQERFWIRTTIKDGLDHERVWVCVQSIEADVISGTIDSDCGWVGSPKFRSEIGVKIADITDWVYVADKRCGPFTIRAAAKLRADARNAAKKDKAK